MERKFHILHFEDNARDAELFRRELAEAGIPCHVAFVQNQQAFLKALDQMRFDLIVSDFSFPLFDGMSALKMVREKCPETPFIFVSGTLVENEAVESLALGAMDYISKRNIARLIPAVRHALRQAEDKSPGGETKELSQEVRGEYESVFENNLVAIATATPDGRILSCNPGYVRMFGFSSAEEAKATNVNELWRDKNSQPNWMALVQSRGQVENLDIQMMSKTGHPTHIIANIVGNFNDRHELRRIQCFFLEDTQNGRERNNS